MTFTSDWKAALWILKRPWLSRWLVPFSEWYVKAAGYRQIGLRYDDLLPEENSDVQLALRRLPPHEAYDRIFRLRRAFQCSVTHQILPKEDWTKAEDDVPYLKVILMEIEAENKERSELESMVVHKRQRNAEETQSH